MRKYEKYKNSGIEWVGEIPEHWKSIRLKYIGDLYGGLSGKSGKDFNQDINEKNKPFIPFVNIANNTVIDIEKLQYVVIEDTEKQNEVNKGDLFFMMSSENFDDVGKSTVLLDNLENTYLNSFCKGFHFTNNNFNSVFINYLLLSKPYRSLVQIEANGFTRLNLKIDKIKSIPLRYPPKKEQLEIANYLDEKLSEIDELIYQKENLLQFYNKEKKVVINEIVTKGINPDVNLKNSDVEYIGQIPEHWSIKKLRYLGVCSNGISKSGDQFGFGFPFVSYSDVYKNLTLPDFVDGLVNSSDTDKISYSVIKGDVLFTRTSETVEEIGIASTCVKTIKDAVFAGFLIRFRPLSNVLFDGFSKYYFSAQIHRRFFVKEMNLVTRASLSQELLKRLPVALPPIEEQKEIAKYLDRYLLEVDSKSAKTKKLIALLKEYKTGLISDVVTGKIKVN